MMCLICCYQHVNCACVSTGSKVWSKTTTLDDFKLSLSDKIKRCANQDAYFLPSNVSHCISTRQLSLLTELVEQGHPLTAHLRIGTVAILLLNLYLVVSDSVAKWDYLKIIIIIINCSYKAQHRLQRPQGAQVNTNMNTKTKTTNYTWERLDGRSGFISSLWIEPV